MIYDDRKAVSGEVKAKRTSGKFSLPKDIDVSILETMPYEYPFRKIDVEMSTDEFTCLCPFSELPDFALLTIKYVPRKKLIELKSLKYYLFAFRNVKVYNEHAVNKILEDLVKILNPYAMTVTGEFTSRGGMKNKIIANFKK